jgi:outer membrane biosynthesis protein TonB
VIRALTTLLGAAAAAAILYFVSDIGQSGGSFWPIALVWLASGLALGVFYQAGGRRAPGLRMNVPLFILGFVPWALLAAALVALDAHKPVWLSDRARDVLPDAWITRWELSLPAFAFGAGLLLAFSLIEPRVGLRPPEPEPEPVPVVETNPYVPSAPWQPPEERPTVVALPSVTEVQPPRPVETEQTAISERPGVPQLEAGSEREPDPPENPVKVISPAPRYAPHDE